MDRRASRRISYRIGVLHVLGRATAPGAQGSDETRLVLDLNARWILADYLQLADRTRLDVRKLANGVASRIRNRLRVEHEMRVRALELVPYADVEAYYDERFGTVSRLRFEGGVTVVTGRRLEWDLYVARQRDSRPVTRFVDALGITLSVKF